MYIVIDYDVIVDPIFFSDDFLQNLQEFYLKEMK